MLKQNIYSALIVSDSLKYNKAILSFLPGEIFEPVIFVSTTGDAKNLINEKFFDVIIINSPTKGDIGSDFCIDIVSSNDSAVLFCYSEPSVSEIKYKLLSQGVFTLFIPASPKVLRQTIEDLVTHRQRLKCLDVKTSTVEEKMQEIRHVNQAKLLLVEKEGMSESDAHQHILRSAMNSHVSKDIIALQIINKWS